MATYSNTSYVAKNIGTSATTIIPALAAGTVAVSSCIVSNTSVSPITTSVYLTRASVNHYLVYQATVPVGGSLEVIQGNRLVMITGDSLSIQNGSAASGDAVVSALTAV
jgi:hypothetical protein